MSTAASMRAHSQIRWHEYRVVLVYCAKKCSFTVHLQWLRHNYLLLIMFIELLPLTESVLPRHWVSTVDLCTQAVRTMAGA